jgi:hypothetical protein
LFFFLLVLTGRRNDGQPLLEITDVERMHGRSVIFLADLQHPADFFDQISGILGLGWVGLG